MTPPSTRAARRSRASSLAASEHDRPGPAPVEPRAPVRLAGSGPARSRTQFTGRAAVLAIVLCGIALSLAYPVREYISQRKQIDQLLAASARVKAEGKSTCRPSTGCCTARSSSRPAGAGPAAHVPARPDLLRDHRFGLHQAEGRGRESKRRAVVRADVVIGGARRTRRPASWRQARPAKAASAEANRQGAPRVSVDARRHRRDQPRQLGRPPRGMSGGRAPVPVRASGRRRDGAEAAGRDSVPDVVLPDLRPGLCGRQQTRGGRADEGDDGPPGGRCGPARVLSGGAS